MNIGIMGFVAAFFVGWFLLGMDDKEILEEFPASIVLTILGVTFFFSLAQKNGTIDSSSNPPSARPAATPGSSRGCSS